MGAGGEIKTWLIELEGPPENLTEWIRFFQDRAVATVERRAGRDGNPALFIHSQRLDGVRDTEADGKARALLAEMNGTIRLFGGKPGRMVWLWFVREGGEPEPMKLVFAQATLAAESLATIIAGAAGESAPAPERRGLKALNVAARCEAAAAALDHFGRPSNWYDLWTAYEIVEDDLWNSTPVKTRPKANRKKQLSPRRVLLRDRGWVSEGDLTKFTESCNYHRHGKRRKLTAERSANTDEARRILEPILRAWLEEKATEFGIV